MTPDERHLARREEARHCPCGLLRESCEEHADDDGCDDDDEEVWW